MKNIYDIIKNYNFQNKEYLNKYSLFKNNYEIRLILYIDPNDLLTYYYVSSYGYSEKYKKLFKYDNKILFTDIDLLNKELNIFLKKELRTNKLQHLLNI